MSNPHLCYPAAAVAVAQGWRQALTTSPLPRTAWGPCPPSGDRAVAWPLQWDEQHRHRHSTCGVLGAALAPPWPLPTPLGHSHSQGQTLPHGTHLSPQVPRAPLVGRCPRLAAPPWQPTVEMSWEGSSRSGWCLRKAGAGCPAEAGAGCPGGEHPPQGNHLWEGAGVIHTGSHQLCTPRAELVSPAGTQDGASEPRSWGEISHCCSRSSRIDSCVESVLPKGEHSG